MIRSTLGTAIAAVLAAGMAVGAPAPAAAAQPPAVRPANDLTLSVGTGKMVRLDAPMSDLFVANEGVADVQVRSTNQIYIFGKGPGQTTVYATDKSGRVVYSANVRVGTNLDSVDDLLRAAMPDAQIRAIPMNGVMLLTGTVAAPADAEEATSLVQAFVGDGTKVVTRLRTATPLQVNLQVKIAEVSRSLIKQIGVNLMAATNHGDPARSVSVGQGSAIDVTTGKVTIPSTGSIFRLAGNILGVDFLSAIQLAENDGRVTTLAEPNLTALSGETASFLAGGEFPIPTSGGLNGTTVEFKQYGVSLAFTPTVLEGGRISMRVRPEVSELSDAGAVRVNGVQIPALTTRRAETTVELGSGQSFMIGGLLRNNASNSVDKAPFLGDLPILGALFRSHSFKRNETELVIIVTPYLVKPVNATQIALPTDGFRTATDAQRVLLDQQQDSRSGLGRPVPHVVAPQTVRPGMGPVGEATAPALPAPAQPQPARQTAAATPAPAPAKRPSATPGFTF
jgi:pilus assembly protein CpaC